MQPCPGSQAIEEYQQAFRRVFGRPPNGPDLLRAIASYERTLVSFDSPFDHFIAGDKNAIDDAAKRGWELFNTQGRCNKCHALTETKRDVTNFTDNDFHNIGIGIIRHNVVALARQAEQLLDSGDTGPSTAPPFRRTCPRSGASSSRRKRPIPPRSRRRTCATCW